MHAHAPSIELGHQAGAEAAKPASRLTTQADFRRLVVRVDLVLIQRCRIVLASAQLNGLVAMLVA